MAKSLDYGALTYFRKENRAFPPLRITARCKIASARKTALFRSGTQFARERLTEGKSREVN